MIVLPGDVSMAARALMARPAHQRWHLACKMARQADMEDRYVKAYGRVHPRWGTGSLMSRASKEPLRSEPTMDDPDYAASQILVLLAIQARRALKDGGTQGGSV